MEPRNWYEVSIMDTLHNATRYIATNINKRNYGMGVFVGTVATLMASKNWTLKEALKEVKIILDRRETTGGNRRIHPTCVPESWHRDAVAVGIFKSRDELFEI